MVMVSSTFHKFIDPIGNALSWFAELVHGPVRSIALGHVTRAGVIDQPLGERPRQHQLALGHGDERVAQSVEPELRATGLGDAAVMPVQFHDMARRAQGRGKHPVPQVCRHGRAVVPAPGKDSGKLTGDGKLQRRPGLGLLDPERSRIEAHPFPTQRHDLAPPHACVKPEQQQVVVHRVDHRSLDALAPARQHLGWRGNPPPRLGVIAPSAGEPQLDRIAQPLVVDAGPAIDRAEKRQALVGRYLAVTLGDEMEAGLNVPAGDRIKRAGEPVAEVEISIAPIAPLGLPRPVVTGLYIVHAGIPQGGQGARIGTLPCGVVPTADASQQFLGQTPPRPPP